VWYTQKINTALFAKPSTLYTAVVYSLSMEIPEGKIHIVKLKSERGKNTYYYARINKRVAGESRVVWSFSLGTAEDILKRYTNKILDRIQFRPFSFGIPAAFLSVAEQTEFLTIVDTATPKRMLDGALTTAQYLMAMMVGRAMGPLSKAATGRRLSDTFLDFIWKPTHHLNTQNFGNHMDKLTVEVVDRITEEFGKKLVSLGIAPSYVLWDTTNYSTNIENYGEKELPQPGNAKDKRFDKNIIGTGLALSDDEIPLYHKVYPGNENDSKLFKRSIDDIVGRIKKLWKRSDNKIILVMDRGNNSEINVQSALRTCHVIGGVDFESVRDLLDVPIEEFKPLYQTRGKGWMKAYRTTKSLWNYEEDFTVIVTHNPATERKQTKSWERAKERILGMLPTLKEKFEKSGGKGRRMTVKGLTTRLAELIYKQYRGVFEWNIDGKGRKFEWKLLEDKERTMVKKFGKNVIFTDLTKWETERIVRTYHSKSKVEKAFRWLHDKLLIPIPPVYHSDDERIRVHIFLCIMALTFLRLIARQLRGVSVSDERLLGELKDLKAAFVKDVPTGAVELKVMEMKAIQASVFSQLDLGKYLRVI